MGAGWVTGVKVDKSLMGFTLRARAVGGMILMVWWKKAFLLIFAFLAWFFGLIVVGNGGYASQYFWLSGSILAVGFAAAPFWRHRGSAWYWPSAGLIIVINLAVMYVERDYIVQPDLPAKGVVQGLFVLDCMACWFLMVGLAYLSDRRFPWND